MTGTISATPIRNGPMTRAAQFERFRLLGARVGGFHQEHLPFEQAETKQGDRNRPPCRVTLLGRNVKSNPSENY